MEPDPPNQQFGRGMRRIRPTQRAQEADLDALPSIKAPPASSSDNDPALPTRRSSHPARTAGRFPSTIQLTPTGTMSFPKGQADTSDPVPAKMEAPKGHDDQSQKPSNRDSHSGNVAASIEAGKLKIEPSVDHNATTVPGLAVTTDLKRSVSGNVMSNAQGAAVPPQQPQSKRGNRVTKPQKSHKKKAAAKKEQTEARSEKKSAPAPRVNINDFKTQDVQLQPHVFAIYFWDRPVPTDFLNLPESVKAEKARADAEWGENDKDPELDDWHEFYGLEPPTVTGLTLKYTIARNFASRAKRALYAGRSWASFEQEELSIDSRAGAMATEDPHERAIALETTLDNDLRLYVFEQIKVRLCHEIWLEPYPEDGEGATTSFRDSAIGTTAPTPTARKGTAVEHAIQRLNALPDRLKSLAYAEGELDSPQPQLQLPVRSQPELPGRDRELHQPEGPPVHMSQASVGRLGLTLDQSLAGVGLDMSTSEGEEPLEEREKDL